MVSNKKLLLLFFLGIFLRIIPLFFRSMEDVVNHVTWTEDILRFGLNGAYDRDFGSRYSIFGIANINYPPLILYLFLACHYLFMLFFKSLWLINNLIPWFPSTFMWYLEQSNYLYLMLKIPSILADLGLAYLMYLMVRNIIGRKSYWPLIAAGSILLNPTFIYCSSAWGQVESVVIFFIVLAFYLVLYKKHYLLSARKIKPHLPHKLPCYKTNAKEILPVRTYIIF